MASRILAGRTFYGEIYERNGLFQDDIDRFFRMNSHRRTPRLSFFPLVMTEFEGVSL